MNQRGVTLVETLVALALTGLILLAIAMAGRMVADTLAGLGRAGERQTATVEADGILRDLVRRASEISLDSNGLRVLAAGAGPDGFKQYYYVFGPRGDDAALVACRRDVATLAPAGCVDRLVIRDAAPITVRALDSARQDYWTTAWEGPDPPAAIAIALQRSGRVWPELIVVTGR